jgi:hypothetical protein
LYLFSQKIRMALGGATVVLIIPQLYKVCKRLTVNFAFETPPAYLMKSNDSLLQLKVIINDLKS